MGKILKILGVIFLVLLVLVSGLVYVGYTFTKVSVSVGDTTINQHISRDNMQVPPTYKGYIVIETDIAIFNGAVLAIQDLHVDLEVFFTGSMLSKTLVGEGNNTLGDIAPGENNTYVIKVNVTENIPILAVDDGVFEIHMYISLYIQYVTRQLNFEKISTAPWDAPF